MKSLPQMSQEFDFWPVCVRLCEAKAFFEMKLFPHRSHMYGLSPVWILGNKRIYIYLFLNKKNEKIPNLIQANNIKLVLSFMYH